MLLSTVFNPSSLLLGLQLLSGVMAGPFKESEISVDARSVDANTSSVFARDLNADQLGALAKQNVRRKQLGIEPLVWDTELQAAAQAYAQTLADTKARYIISNPATRPGQGENTRWLWIWPNEKENAPLTRAANDCLLIYLNWMNGRFNYKNYGGKNRYDMRYPSDGADYYTQCIWRATTKVGIASASYVDTKTGWTYIYVVARYSVRGNIYGQYIY